MKIKKWLGVAALATVAGLALQLAETQKRKQTMQQLSKSQRLTVAVLKKNVGTKFKNWLKKTALPWNLQSSQTTHNQQGNC